MLTVHHLGLSQSDRIVWLCEELGIDYEMVKYDRDPASGMAPADYKALHPFGTAPVITDGDLVLGESGAIVDYIVARHGGGRLTLKPDDADFADWLFWFHFANASIMPTAMVELIVGRLGVSGDIMAMIGDRGRRAFAMIEQRLGEATWFAGDAFTTADIMMLFPLTTMRMFAPRDISDNPNTLAYLQRIAARPAWQRAMQKADPDLVQMMA